MRLSLDVTGDERLERDLLRWARRAEDMRPALDAVADDFRVIERKQFDSEGAYASGGWAPLAPSTVARRGNAHPILRSPGADGGRLRRSLTTKGARDNIRRVTADSVEVGTRTPYARYHQRGTSRMPQRRPVELTEADRRQWVKIIHDHLMAAFGDRGAV